MNSLLIPLIAFVFAVSFTPGPNNVMLTASAANFGFKRTLPHIFGILFGFPVMILAVGIGLGEVFTAYPQLHEILKLAGSAYLLFLAWKIASAGRPKTSGRGSRPLTFLQAALFQWVNPKGWLAAIAALTNFTTGAGNYLSETLVVAGVFLIAGSGATFLWAFFGAIIGQLLKTPLALMVFNSLMAMLIVASIALLYL